MNKRSDPRGPAGTAIRATGKDGPQVIHSKGKRWTDQAEKLFLDHLAASCNVTASAAAAGFSTVAIYNRRRADPGFAARWDAALDQGYARIEMLLVHRAGQLLEGYVPDPGSPLASMTVKEAINVLQLHRARVKGDGARAPGWRPRPRGFEEMRDSILGKLEAIETARLALPPPDGA
ncbi:hypothetical protein OF829_11500 [Sphingomonas sp. LB-2]|uniref:hypothetical protein n=1 Tax=Sphingomonas caeni TaxID=2984949 RepID=UPI00222FACD9|nr:hypothetical protein [Sphingomonas caeni]MCW3847866.1 hypothetical protein [Sphingomonas caeni]